MIVNMSVVIEIVKSFAIITQKEARDGPYLKKKCKECKVELTVGIYSIVMWQISLNGNL